MKRPFAPLLTALAATALFVGLVYAALLVARVAEPSDTTIYGATPRRLWATAAAALALIGVIFGGLGLRRSAAGHGTGGGRKEATVALVLGLIAAANGGLNLAVAQGGPGSGNGVVGGAAALVLGLVALVLAGCALARSPRSV